MKKIAALSAALVLTAAGFTGCGNDDKTSSGAATQGTTQATTTQPATTQAATTQTATTQAATTATETRPAASSTKDGFDSVVDDLENTGKDIVTGAGDAVKDAKDMLTNP